MPGSDGLSTASLPTVFACSVPVGWEPDTEQNSAAVQEVKKKVQFACRNPFWASAGGASISKLLVVVLTTGGGLGAVPTVLLIAACST